MTMRFLKTACLFFALVASTTIYSQTVKPYEFEISLGATAPLERYSNEKSMIGPHVGLHLRYNLADKPWAVGVLMQVDAAVREQNNHLYSSDDWQSYRTIAFALSGEYNLRQGQKVNPFVSIAVGMASTESFGDSEDDPQRTSPLFLPKIGVELWHFLRVSAYTKLTRKGYNTAGITLGITLGGRPRK